MGELPLGDDGQARHAVPAGDQIRQSLSVVGSVELNDEDGRVVRTGPALAKSSHWTAPRQPFLLEASRPGVFAAGDVRSGSVKRVASAVGEGAMAVQFVHARMPAPVGASS